MAIKKRAPWNPHKTWKGYKEEPLKDKLTKQFQKIQRELEKERIVEGKGASDFGKSIVKCFKSN